MDATDFRAMNIKQLKQYCRDHKISGYSSLRKADIVNLILSSTQKKPTPKVQPECSLNSDDESQCPGCQFATQKCKCQEPILIHVNGVRCRWQEYDLPPNPL